MQKTFNHKSPQPNMISRALNRPTPADEATFKMIKGATDTNPLQLSLVEQVQRMQWAIMVVAKKLGPDASNEEYETVLNRLLPRIGINMRATVEMNDDES